MPWIEETPRGRMLSRVGAAEAALYHDDSGREPERTIFEKVWDLVKTALPRGAVILSVLTFAGYALALLQKRILTHTFGAGPEVDAFLAAFKLPELALQILVMGGVVGPFLPLFVGLNGEAKETAREFARTIMTLAALAMGIAAAVLFVIAPQTVQIVAPGFAGEQQTWYVDMFRLLCVAQVLASVSMVLGEILVAERRWITYGVYDLFYHAGIGGGASAPGSHHRHLRSRGRGHRRRRGRTRGPRLRGRADGLRHPPEPGAPGQGPRRIHAPDDAQDGRPAPHLHHGHLLRQPRVHARSGIGDGRGHRPELPEPARDAHRRGLRHGRLPGARGRGQCRRQASLQAGLRHQSGDDRFLLHLRGARAALP